MKSKTPLLAGIKTMYDKSRKLAKFAGFLLFNVGYGISARG
ncbi:hypothetical protein [Robinsoniella peoriensis]